jgi:pimeloyl-ACP methyl ester carboxylesterase
MPARVAVPVDRGAARYGERPSIDGSEGRVRRTTDLPGAGVRLRADVVGDPGGRPVVLLHGGGQTRHSWATTGEILAARGWCAYLVDLRGHGDSEWPADGDYGLDAFAGDVRAIAGSLDRPPVLVGASLGGVASLLAVGESDDELAAALVLVDVGHRNEEAGTERIRGFMFERMETGFVSLDEVADAIAAYNPHRPRPTDLTGLLPNVRQRDDGRWYWHWDPVFMAETEDFVDEVRLAAAARRLRLPVLMVRGRASDVLSPEGVREFLAMVPHARFVDVAGAGHMVAGDRNDLFNDAIVEFIAELPE